MNLPVAFFLFVSVAAAHANDIYQFEKQWPGNCCNLKLEKHILGSEFPEQTIWYGSGPGSRYAHAFRFVNGDAVLMSIPENKKEKPVTMSNDGCSGGKDLIGSRVYLVTNGWKCAYGWYRAGPAGTRPSQPLPNTNDPDIKDTLFFPKFKGKHLAGEESSSGEKAIGLYDHGCPHTRSKFETCNRSDVLLGIDVLYVDCYGSMLTMIGMESATAHAVINGKTVDISSLFPQDDGGPAFAEIAELGGKGQLQLSLANGQVRVVSCPIGGPVDEENCETISEVDYQVVRTLIELN